RGGAAYGGADQNELLQALGAELVHGLGDVGVDAASHGDGHDRVVLGGEVGPDRRPLAQVAVRLVRQHDAHRAGADGVGLDLVVVAAGEVRDVLRGIGLALETDGVNGR